MSGVLTKVPRAAELNRLLLVLDELDSGNGVTKTALFELMSAMSFGGQLPDNEATLSFAACIGLVERSRGRWTATDVGRELLAANPRRSYELTAAQRAVLIEHALISGAYADLARDVLRSFRMDAASDTWAGGPLQTLDQVQRSLVSFMVALGVLTVTSRGLEVPASHLPAVSRMRCRTPVSAEELEECLLRQRFSGAAAEEWVLRFEAERLELAGCLAEARALRQVSRVDVLAGYDIASFDGGSATLSYERFIEVKSCSSQSFAFFWSSNEIAVARELRRRYWLYLVRLAQDGAGWLARVQDPVSLLRRPGGITLKPSAYRGKMSRLRPEFVAAPRPRVALGSQEGL